MNLNKRAVTRLVVVAGLATAGSTLAATPDDPMGRPAGYQGVNKPAIDTADLVNDAFAGGGQQGIVPMRLPDTLTQPATPGEGQGPLEHPASVQVEFETAPTKQQESLAAAINAAWQAGDYTLGRDLIDQLRDTGFDGGIGFSYIYDDQPAGKFFDAFSPERRVGGTRTGATTYEMDFAPNGTLYAVVSWPDTWTLNRSADGGNTWTETYSWGAQPGDVDIAVVDGFVYVGYLFSNTGRMRRFDAGTGASDAAYGSPFLFTGTGGELPLLDVAIEGNADTFNNRIFFGTLKSDGTIFFSWDESSDGLTPTELSPLIANATPPLDMAWNADFATYGVFMSYGTATGDAGVSRWDGFSWPLTTVQPGLAAGADIAISGYQDTIIVGYQLPGTAVQYDISYNGGDSYGFGANFPTALNNKTDVAASLGYGTAQLTGVEVGEPDILRVVHRPTYAPGAWTNNVDSNQIDVLTGSKVAIEALPAFGGGAYSYGVMHMAIGGVPYFDRIDDTGSCIGDIADDFGFLGGDGMVSFGDFLALLGLIGPCPGGIPGCTGDIADDFGFLGGDGMVSFGDFLALLGLIGPCP